MLYVYNYFYIVFADAEIYWLSSKKLMHIYILSVMEISLCPIEYGSLLASLPPRSFYNAIVKHRHLLYYYFLIYAL